MGRNTLKRAVSSLEIHLSDAVERQRPGAARAERFRAGGQEGTWRCHQHRQCPHQRDTRCHGASARWAKLGPGGRTHRQSQKWQIISQGLGLSRAPVGIKRKRAGDGTVEVWGPPRAWWCPQGCDGWWCITVYTRGLNELLGLSVILWGKKRLVGACVPQSTAVCGGLSLSSSTNTFMYVVTCQLELFFWEFWRTGLFLRVFKHADR